MTGDILLALVVLDLVAGGSALWRLITSEWPWATIRVLWRWIAARATR